MDLLKLTSCLTYHLIPENLTIFTLNAKIAQLFDINILVMQQVVTTSIYDLIK